MYPVRVESNNYIPSRAVNSVNKMEYPIVPVVKIDKTFDSPFNVLKNQETLNFSIQNLDNGSNTVKPLPNEYNPDFQHNMNFNYDLQVFCSIHNREEIKYFCFTCLQEPICAECVIHGKHKNHNVQHIKSAIPPVVSNLHDVLKVFKTNLEYLNSLNYKTNLIGKERKENYESFKSKIKTIFDDLRTKLDSKENEIYKIIDQYFNYSIKSFDPNIPQKYSNLKNNFDIIQRNYFTTNPINLLNFFAKNNESLRNELANESDIKFKYRDPQLIENPLNNEFITNLKNFNSKINDIISEIKPSNVIHENQLFSLDNPGFNLLKDNRMI